MAAKYTESVSLVHGGIDLLSSKNRKGYGMNTMVKQTVILRETAKINDRTFQRSKNFFIFQASN